MEAENKAKKVKKLSNYLLLDPPIGEGNFGKVYKCIDENDHKKLYACKCLNIDFYYSNSVYLSKLKQELALTRNLNHPNLVKLIDLKRTKHNLYMILAYINGDNLENFINHYYSSFKHGPTMVLVRYIATEIMSAMSYLGNNKIIHRDIKLENIMFNFVKESTQLGSICDLDKEILINSESVEQSMDSINLNIDQIDVDKSTLSLIRYMMEIIIAFKIR